MKYNIKIERINVLLSLYFLFLKTKIRKYEKSFDFNGIFHIIFLASLRKKKYAGIAQLARASAFQAEGCEFESHCPLHFKLKKRKLKRQINPLTFFNTNIWVYSSVG